VKSQLFSLKNTTKQSLERILPFYQLGFFEALLWGEENNISDQWKERLNLTGTRHVAAVSGMNITIISTLVLNFLLGLGLWRKHSFWLSLVLISLYVLMIGAPASGVRAGIMAGLFLFSQYSGRLVDGQRLVLLAAGLMVLVNPLLLRFDIGFQLSFLAILGLIYFGPLFSRWFKKVPNVLGLRMNLCSTLAAQVFVLPILLYNFGRVSLVSPLVNVLILPFIPLLTILGFIFSFLGVFSQKLGWLISLPSQLVLEVMMKIIEFFSSFSWAALRIKVSGWFVLVAYLGLFVLVYFLKRKQRLSFLDYSFY
jgi:competence protein ComEC